MDIKKSSGIIFHPSALPSRYGIGDFGSEAKEFINFLETTETKIWQVLPLGLTSNKEYSPYSSPSSILGNRYLIDLKQLIDYDPMLSDKKFDNKSVDYKNVYEFKDSIFKKISENIDINDSTYFDFINDDLIRKHITYIINIHYEFKKSCVM